MSRKHQVGAGAASKLPDPMQTPRVADPDESIFADDADEVSPRVAGTGNRLVFDMSPTPRGKCDNSVPLVFDSAAVASSAAAVARAVSMEEGGEPSGNAAAGADPSKVSGGGGGAGGSLFASLAATMAAAEEAEVARKAQTTESSGQGAEEASTAALMAGAELAFEGNDMGMELPRQVTTLSPLLPPLIYFGGE